MLMPPVVMIAGLGLLLPGLAGRDSPLHDARETWMISWMLEVREDGHEKLVNFSRAIEDRGSGMLLKRQSRPASPTTNVTASVV